jgi:hypothetical protein
MSEPTLLTMPRFEWKSALRLASKGNADASHALQHLFDDYKPVTCFLCGKLTADPFSQPLPEPSDASMIVVTAICAGCATMPSYARVNQCIGMARKLYFGDKRPVQLDFHPSDGDCQSLCPYFIARERA